MNTIFSALLEGFLRIWHALTGGHSDVADSGVLGASEFEKEGPGVLSAVIIGAGFLLLVACFVFLR